MKFKVYYWAVFLFISSQIVVAQDKIAGIEFSKKFVKTLIIENKNSVKKEYRIRNFWIENIPDGLDSQNRNQMLIELIRQISDKLRMELNIKEDKLYVISDQFAFTSEEQKMLMQHLKLLKLTNVKFFTVLESSGYLFNGIFKEGRDTSKAVLLNMDEINAFYSGFDILNKKQVFTGTLIENSGYLDNLEKASTRSENQTAVFSSQELQTAIYTASKMSSLLNSKEEIYLSGDTPWMFFTLINGGFAPNEFNECKLTDIEKHQNTLETNFKRYEILSSASIEVEKVIKTHNKGELLMANYILLHTLRNVNQLSKKKLYYCKNWNNAKLMNYLSTQIDN